MHKCKQIQEHSSFAKYIRKRKNIKSLYISVIPTFVVWYLSFLFLFADSDVFISTCLKRQRIHSIVNISLSHRRFSIATLVLCAYYQDKQNVICSLGIKQSNCSYDSWLVGKKKHFCVISIRQIVADLSYFCVNFYLRCLFCLRGSARISSRRLKMLILLLWPENGQGLSHKGNGCF